MSDIKGIKIAITGEMRSGKDTVGRILCEHYGFKRFAFGDGIVETCKKLFPDAFANGKPRKLLQEFGQFCVQQDRLVWVKYMLRKMKSHGVNLDVDNIVVTDLRQPHEYQKLVEAGFTIVRINCKPEKRKERIIQSGEVFSEETFNHPTEKFVRTFEVDYDIDNNGTYEELFQQVRNILTNITGGGIDGGTW